MEHNTNFNEFDFLKLFNKDSFVLAIIGSSGCGKTTLLKYMLDLSKKYYTNIFLFQGSAPSEDNLYTDYIWPADVEYITDIDDKTYKSNFKTLIVQYNTLIAEYNTDIRDKNKKNEDKIPLIKTMFIFDDFGPNNKYFSDFANVSRHSLSSFVFIIHNDTDLDLTFRKKITHYFINVCFPLNQIGDIFKGLRVLYEDIRKKFIENNQKKCFIILDRDNPLDIQYFYLNEFHLEKLRNSNSVLFRCSKQRCCMKTMIQNLAKMIRKDSIQ